MSIIIGWCELKEETVESMLIAYSLDHNQNCDGELIYDKNTQLVTIKKLSEGSSEYWTKHFIGLLRGRIRKGMELRKKYMLAS